MPAGAGALHADLVDAAGGALHERVSRGAREDEFSRAVQESGAGGGGDRDGGRAAGGDAAIIFADILLILEPMGIELEFAKGEGPVIHNPVREAVGRGSTA